MSVRLGLVDGKGYWEGSICFGRLHKTSFHPALFAQRASRFSATFSHQLLSSKQCMAIAANVACGGLCCIIICPNPQQTRSTFAGAHLKSYHFEIVRSHLK